ncbi:uncharacterized protein TNCV_2570131 [Trichonephila clavipes]|nr:uncharacterized protein TNCV_2570131 [Trichonephila clavipes]
MVTYRPQANLTERANRNLVQMIACFVKENHENWDRFLHEFAFALRTSVNETTNKTPAGLFLGQRLSDRSSRSQPGKFKGSRKTSSEQSNGHKSRKGNAGWEDPRLKRKVESNGSGDRKNLKRSKICRKRSLQGSEHRNQKRPTPEPKQGIKRAIPSSVSSRNYKYRRPNNPSQGSQPISRPSHQQDSRQDKSPTVASRHERSGQYNKAR